MRVLHIGKFFPPFAGGMEQFLAALLPALRDQGIETAALVHGHGEYNGSIENWQGCPLYRTPCYGRLLYAPLSPAFPFWLSRAIRTFKPQLLHLHLPNTSAFWALAQPAARRLPWLIHWHADVVASIIEPRLALAYRFYRPFEQNLLQRSQAVIVTSPPYLQASPALRAWRQRCHIIPLGLDQAQLPAPSAQALAQAEKHWSNSGCRVLAIGRLTYYKGFEVLLHAVAQNPALQLRIVGAGENRLVLQKRLDDLGLQPRAQLLGYQDDASRNALLASCDLFCLPSLERTEAFGVSLLEAMRFGKPIIATDIPGSGVGWVVRQGDCGRLAPPGDAAALAKALTALAQSPGQRQTFGDNGYRGFQNQFAIGPVAAQTAQLYRQLLAEPVPG